jgi:hypothetical protein
MRFTYSSGQRVLDGYLIKRGIGRGGFGEVYYAISDGGKEVALKLVRGDNLDVELRGMAQCLNLKHPNLLALFDLRRDAQGDHWVVMEYISGESLAGVLARHPQGLPVELAVQWFLALARGVGYLHDQGIVHRDLKPGNIFLEGGTIKVGDYGLCKFISSSQHAAQTQSVGTVHYMAPEISTGNYNKQVDVYAAGIILYEMLTGKVPFDGESTGEILMKHLTSPPDLGALPSEFQAIVGKALAKNPAHRYQTMNEMARVVEAVGGGEQSAPRAMPVYARAPAAAAPVARPLQTTMPMRGSVRGQLGELCGSMALTAVFAAIAYTIWASVGAASDATEVGWGFFTTVAASWAVLVPAKAWNGHHGDSGLRRAVMLLLGALVGVGGYWLDGGTMAWRSAEALWGPVEDGASPLLVFGHRAGLAQLAGYLSYFRLAFFAVRWWKLADRHRAHRFSLAPLFAVAFWALVLLVVWPWPKPALGVLPLVLTAGIVQLVSPWDPPLQPSARRMRLRYA